MTTAIGTKPAAIWARVSTKAQNEISPDTQISQCQQLLKSKGYIATKIFNIDFCSLDLSVSNEFQQLQHMIQTHEIDAVVCYDRDRLMADGVDRLVFLTQIREAGVELFVCNGAPIMDTDEGQIVELALALGKKRSVLRARTGSRDGLRQRVMGTSKHSPRPVNHRQVYGYDWNTETETLTPNAEYENIKMIFDLALSGEGYRKIAYILAKKGISSPKGNTWNKGVISSLMHNSVYAGRFASLKTTTVRNTNQPGKKLKPLPESEWTFMPSVIIKQHPITWEQRTDLFEQIQKRINFSKRHANYDYLLRGMIESDKYVSVKGKHLKYRGCPMHKSYGYIFRTAGDNHYINGIKLEDTIKKAITELFASESPSFWEKMKGIEKINRPELEDELKKLQVKLSKSFRNEAALEERNMNGLAPEVYDLLYAKFQVQRKAIEEGLRETQEQLNNASQIEEKVQSFDEIRTKFLENTEGFSTKQWRDLLETLDCRIRIFIGQAPGHNAIKDVVLTNLEQFLLKNYTFNDKVVDAACLLKDFNAIMFIKAPFRNPEKIKELGYHNL